MPEDIEDESVVVEVETTGEEEEQDTRAQVSSNDDGDELDSYSKNVQTRIKKLTEKYRNEERVRTEAERLYQQVLAENQQLKGRVQNLDKGYLNEFGGRLEGQIESAKRLYREAHDSGDVDAMLAAQDQLNRMGIEQERLRIAKQRADVQQPERQQYVTQQQTQQAAPQAKPDPKAQSWAEKNEWFGTIVRLIGVCERSFRIVSLVKNRVERRSPLLFLQHPAALQNRGAGRSNFRRLK